MLVRAFEVVSFLPSIVPDEAALKIPTSSTVFDPVAVHSYTNLSVSFVAVVVVLETVADARASPVSVISAPSRIVTGKQGQRQ